MRCALLLVFLAGVAAQDFDEAFTIFIDLDDFHVTQADNHEFLSHDAIGEHDNVVLHLSESEVRHHQRTHDTHSCEHPAEIHEVVSFIQEKMYERPTSPNYIDDLSYAIGSGFNPQAMPQAFPNMWGMPFSSQPVAKPQPVAPAVQVPVAAPVAAPMAVAATPMEVPAVAQPSIDATSVSAASAPTSTESDEEAAMARFRDAYRAFKYFNHALTGLGDLSGPASTAMAGASGSASTPALTNLFSALNNVQPQVAESNGTPKQTGWLDSLIDDDDRRLMGMFSGHRNNNQFTGSKSAFASMAAPIVPAMDSALEGQISKIVDEAYQNALTDQGDVPDIAQFDSPVGSEQEQHHHHKKDHHDKSSHHEKEHKKKHHHHDEAQVEEQPAAETFTEQDQETLKNLVAKLAASGKATQLESVLSNAMKTQIEATPAKIDAIPPTTAGTTATVEASVPEPAKSETQVPVPKAETPVTVAQPAPVGASRPAAPVTTSHISPLPTEFIPENVYAQESVPFTEQIPQQLKHVPKRILIPRMEEPGPVIGGGSRPLHIQIPTSDDFKVSNTRPSAPMQIQISSASSITTAAEAAGQNDVSVKASSLASANDEALTQPEVVIF